MTLSNLKPTIEKTNFFENVNFNVNLLTKLVPELENKFNKTTNPIKKANVMMELLKADSQLSINLSLLR